ncbi:uncharacterized protein LOC100116942 isoform X2 [Nasonia vitripennis]|uniref:Uncharacterized protein n=1 Tax=Nasonia vitripennis TaxID=7425 RepID=A0A7M7HDI6_NASVI|nr:uncharacterized protein LOC100116942 isoform X2 [Nasonia vitripennis]
MLKQPRFSLVEKRVEKSDGADSKKVTGASWQKPGTRQTMSYRKKSTSSRPYERAGRTRIARKEEKIEASSTESTNLSDKQKMGSVLALRREINEWRRQEDLRSKVNEALERSARVTGATDTEDNKENTKFNDTPKCIVEASTEETNKENYAETKDDMSSGRSRSKAKSRKEDGEKIPVTWISVQPDASTRTSLRSVADYLSEKETESPLSQHRPNRSLRLSPASLQALERAERLVEDAERQLSRLNFDAVLADACDGDRLLDETSAYIRRIVATSFETGAYEPAPISETLIPARSKSRPSSASASASGRATGPRGPSESKPAAPAIDDDCPLCCGKSARAAAQAPAGGCVGSDKLSVQRGPAISIKADLCVRTSRIVDIQPSGDPLPTWPRAAPADNVASFQFQHESFANGESAAAEKLEASGRKDATTSVTGLVQPAEPAGNRSPAASEPPESLPKLDASSDADLSLGEPGIIADLDALLSQQRTIIRRVHQSSQALEQLLRKSDNGADYSAGSFDSVHCSHDSLQAGSAAAASIRESCQSDAGFIENLKSSSLQLPKAGDLTADSTARRRVEKEIGENGASIGVSANRGESRATSDIDTGKVNESGFIDANRNNSEEAEEKESRGPGVSSVSQAIGEEQGPGRDSLNIDDKRIGEKGSGDAIGIVDERGETGGEDSLHKTSHLVDSLSDDQSLRQLSDQLMVQSQLDSKAAQDNRHDGVLTASAELIVGRQTSVGLDRATTREYSRVSANNRPLLTAYQHDGIVLLEPPSSVHQKLNLLEKLESCSIPNRHHYCKRLPFSSTVLSDAAQPAGSNAESSELSSEAAHSEGEFCLSSSASYSLGEVRRKNVNSIAGSQSCSTKVSSTSSAISQLEAPPFQCSIGELIGPSYNQVIIADK